MKYPVITGREEIIQLPSKMIGLYVIYGYSNREKNISRSITPINYVSETSEVGTTEKRICDSSMSKMSRSSRDYDDFER